jgi:hypothetical protein
MASPSTLSRLHCAPQPEPVKLPDCGNLQIDASAPSLLELQERSLRLPRRFGRRHGPEVDAPAIMGSVQMGVAVDRDVAALQARGRVCAASLRGRSCAARRPA